MRLSLFAPVRQTAPILTTLALVGAASASAQAGAKAKVNEYGNPMKHAAQPTAAAINEADLRTRLYIFSDDSMMGRQIGREGNMKGTQYIADELKKLGIAPGAWDGTYFQNFGFVQRKYLPSSQLSVNGSSLKWNADFVAIPNSQVASPRQIDSNAVVIFGGVTGDTVNTLTAEQATGKVVLLLPRPAGTGGGAGRGGRGGGGGAGGAGAAGRGGAGGRGAPGAAPAPVPVNPLAGAAAVITVDLDPLTMASRAELNNPQAVTPNAGGRGGRGGGAGAAGAQTPAPAPVLRVTTAAAERLLGRTLAGTPVGTLGGKVTSDLVYANRTTNYARNVIGIIPGSDPKLKGQYVAISAHNDHVGYGAPVASHDSLRAVLAANMIARIQGDTLVNMSPELAASIKPIDFDAIRKANPKARPDSIRNGADDDGSGSMGILEIAEAIQKSPVKPKRSIIFIWHTGEEAGMDGSRGFTSDPSVPLDSIVTAINVDMIGRGRAGDIPGGGPKYLGVVGSRVLSQELGDEVLIANKKQPTPFTLDFRYDLPTTGWQGYDNIYRRSDHINYANKGIPIVFFFTGLHADYHQVTDEAQYIDYPHYASIAKYIKDLLVDLANRPNPVKLDKPKVITP